MRACVRVRVRTLVLDFFNVLNVSKKETIK